MNVENDFKHREWINNGYSMNAYSCRNGWMHGEEEWKFQNGWVNVKCTHFLNEYAKKYFSNN